MANTLRQGAMSYEPMVTLNIADLPEVSTEIDIQTKTATRKDGSEFTYDYIMVNKKEYRVPLTVLKQLKAQLKEKPGCTKFKVTKEGSGKTGTEYFVTLLD